MKSKWLKAIYLPHDIGGRNLRPPYKLNPNMTNNKTLVGLPEETIINKIILIRGQKVMIDRDLADL